MPKELMCRRYGLLPFLFPIPAQHAHINGWEGGSHFYIGVPHRCELTKKFLELLELAPSGVMDINDAAHKLSVRASLPCHIL